MFICIISRSHSGIACHFVPSVVHPSLSEIEQLLELEPHSQSLISEVSFKHKQLLQESLQA